VTPDEKVGRLILRMFRSDTAATLRPLGIGRPADSTPEGHLALCEEATVLDPDASDGTYGCDTGCDYVTLEAQIACPHVAAPVEYEYGDFGTMAMLLDDLDEMDAADRERET
jgi:hypothetical protein